MPSIKPTSKGLMKRIPLRRLKRKKRKNKQVVAQQIRRLNKVYFAHSSKRFSFYKTSSAYRLRRKKILLLSLTEKKNNLFCNISKAYYQKNVYPIAVQKHFNKLLPQESPKLKILEYKIKSHQGWNKKTNKLKRKILNKLKSTLLLLRDKKIRKTTLERAYALVKQQEKNNHRYNMRFRNALKRKSLTTTFNFLMSHVKRFNTIISFLKKKYYIYPSVKKKNRKKVALKLKKKK